MWSLCLMPGGHGSSLHWWSRGSHGVWPATHTHTPIANMCSCLHGRVLHPTHPASRHPASLCYFPTTQPASTISLSPPSSSQTSGMWTRLFAAKKEVPGFSAGGFRWSGLYNGPSVSGGYSPNPGPQQCRTHKKLRKWIVLLPESASFTENGNAEESGLSEYTFKR